jgi:hypothetical protein
MSEQPTAPNRETSATETESEAVQDKSRREMLSAAVKFSGIMAGLGLCGQTLLGSREAQAKTETETECSPSAIKPQLLEGQGLPGVDVDGDALRALMVEAFEGGSMSKAIRKWGKATKLPKSVLKQLRQISDKDIAALAVIRQQLQASLNGIAIAAPWTVHEHATYRTKS